MPPPLRDAEVAEAGHTTLRPSSEARLGEERGVELLYRPAEARDRARTGVCAEHMGRYPTAFLSRFPPLCCEHD